MREFEIVSGYTILHFDEYPILFVGFNFQNKIVIGSFMYEDDQENLLFFHSIVSSNVVVDFLNRRITYLTVMEKALFICILTKDYNENTIAYEKISFDSIDSSLLPSISSFCPETDTEIIKTFEINQPSFYSRKFSLNKTHKVLVLGSEYKNRHIRILPSSRYKYSSHVVISSKRIKASHSVYSTSSSNRNLPKKQFNHV